MGKVALTVTEGQGVTLVQVIGLSPEEERAGLRLYHKLKPIIRQINLDMTAPRGHNVRTITGKQP